MPVEQFIISVFCLIDDLYLSLITGPLRKRGAPPKLADSEAIAIEITGEWLGFHNDKAIWKYFKNHWSHLFPNLPVRSQFVRQTATLWAVKQKMHRTLVEQLGAKSSDIHLVDGFPMEVCVRTRAKGSKIYKDEAAFGYCAAKKKSFYGFHGHLITDGRGVPVDMTVTAANVDKRVSIYDLLQDIDGLVIGDKGYIKPALKLDCQSYSIDLQTPLRKNMRDDRPKWVVRRRIETVIGQFVEYFEIERARTRDKWHLTSRIARKLLGFVVGVVGIVGVVGVYLNDQIGKKLLQFEDLITA